jgi:Peptidase inhibitor I78 family
VLERARVDAGAQLARFLRPNQPVTTEYSGSRVNLNLDARDIVRSVVCS